MYVRHREITEGLVENKSIYCSDSQVWFSLGRAIQSAGLLYRGLRKGSYIKMAADFAIWFSFCRGSCLMFAHLHPTYLFPNFAKLPRASERPYCFEKTNGLGQELSSLSFCNKKAL